MRLPALKMASKHDESLTILRASVFLQTLHFGCMCDENHDKIPALEQNGGSVPLVEGSATLLLLEGFTSSRNLSCTGTSGPPSDFRILESLSTMT